MKASVIIVGNSQKQVLPYVLKAYDLQAVKPHELIYVDNDTRGSSNIKNHIKASSTKFKIKYINNFHKQNLASCYNLAVSMATGDLLVFMGESLIPDYFFLEHLQKAHDGNHVLIGQKLLIDREQLCFLKPEEAFVNYEKKYRWHKLASLVFEVDVLARFMDQINSVSGRPYAFTPDAGVAIPKKILEMADGFNSQLDEAISPLQAATMRIFFDGGILRYISGALAFDAQPSVRRPEASLEQLSTRLMAFHAYEKTVLGRLNKIAATLWVLLKKIWNEAGG